MFGTVSLPPTGPIAMRNQRYPLTELGILNLTRRLVEVGEHDLKYGECDVKFYEGAKSTNASARASRSSIRSLAVISSSILPASSLTRTQRAHPL